MTTFNNTHINSKIAYLIVTADNKRKENDNFFPFHFNFLLIWIKRGTRCEITKKPIVFS